MAVNTPGRIQDLFSAAFSRAWEVAIAELALRGIEVGARVRNADGDLFEITTIKPTTYNFGDAPTAGISCYGIKYRADRTWGTHKHWTGDIADLKVE